MRKRRLWAIGVLGVLAAAGSGCEGDLNSSSGLGGGPERIVIPPGVAGTVAEYAHLAGAGEMAVRGYGVVVGLGKTGSSEVPPALRKYITEQMLKNRVGSATAGAGALTPARMLADEDTAVVLVRGRIPPAVPPGTRFDLYVEALPGTQTVSLDGGVLMTTELHPALDNSMATLGKAKTWGRGRGALFVNPFLAQAKPARRSELRRAMIPDGGRVTRDRQIRLELRRSDYHIASLIQRRVNHRFGKGGLKVAQAKGPALIELKVPAAYRGDYRHFLELVTHVYVPGGPEAQERHARQLTEAVELPTARHEDISLAWEAMGRQVLPILQPLYASANPAAAFYSVRAGLRLGDAAAVGPMIHVATQAKGTFQVPAIQELGRARGLAQCLGTLKRLLSEDNALLRVTAYEALVAHGPTSAVQREDVSGQFVLDVVRAEGDYAVYATRTGRPKIVLFGRDIPVRRPLFYCPPDELVTINAFRADRDIRVYRKIPRSGQMSETFTVQPTAEEMIRTLGKLPTPGRDGRPEGLGLTYSQVVGVLYGLCKQGHVPAKFVLQRPPEVRRIYSLTPGMGRPDAPEEGGE